MKKLVWSLLLALLSLSFINIGMVVGFGDNPFDGEIEWDIEEKLSGRDFVALGNLATINGELFTESNEWFLQSDAMIYEIHLGDHGYREEIGLALEAGVEASIYGYLYGDDMAVVSLTMGGKTYFFRTEEGLPLWGSFGRGGKRKAVLERIER